MNLFLLTEEEKKTLKSDILIEPIVFNSFGDILTELYNLDYDRIILTRRYIETVGEKKVYNALKALMVMSTNFSTNLFILDHRESFIDSYTPMFIEMGVKVINIEVKEISYEEYLNLYTLPKINVEKTALGSVDEEVSALVAEIKSISSNNMKSYVEANYSRIISTVMRCEQALLSHKDIGKEVVDLSGQITQLKAALDYHQDRLAYERYRNSELEYVNDNAQQILLRYASAIKEYNSTVLRTNINEEYVYHSNDRKTVVIYFKELEDIGFFKLFDVLYNTLKLTYNLRVKSIVLESNVRRYFNPYKGYKILSNVPKTNEVVLNDKLVKYGNARKVIEVITRPQMQLDFLLVYDRTYTPEICAQFNEQYTFFLGNKRENYVGLGYDIPDDNFISPLEGSYTDMSFIYRDTDDISDISLKIYCNRCYLFTELVNLCLRLSKS